MQGIITESVQEIEKRLNRVVKNLYMNIEHPLKTMLPHKIMLSILNSDSLLSAISQSKDIKQLYSAQDTTKKILGLIKAKIET